MGFGWVGLGLDVILLLYRADLILSLPMHMAEEIQGYEQVLHSREVIVLKAKGWPAAQDLLTLAQHITSWLG